MTFISEFVFPIAVICKDSDRSTTIYENCSYIYVCMHVPCVVHFFAIVAHLGLIVAIVV